MGFSSDDGGTVVADVLDPMETYKRQKRERLILNPYKDKFTVVKWFVLLT